jgi:hypothetical protein
MAPLPPLCGTPVGNHWTGVLSYDYFTRINEGPDEDALLHGGASTTANTDITTAHDDSALLKSSFA